MSLLCKNIPLLHITLLIFKYSSVKLIIQVLVKIKRSEVFTVRNVTQKLNF